MDYNITLAGDRDLEDSLEVIYDLAFDKSEGELYTLKTEIDNKNG